jgi:hypothetical protein
MYCFECVRAQANVASLQAQLRSDADAERANTALLLAKIEELLSDPTKHPELLALQRCR